MTDKKSMKYILLITIFISFNIFAKTCTTRIIEKDKNISRRTCDSRNGWKEYMDIFNNDIIGEGAIAKDGKVMVFKEAIFRNNKIVSYRSDSSAKMTYYKLSGYYSDRLKKEQAFIKNKAKSLFNCVKVKEGIVKCTDSKLYFINEKDVCHSSISGENTILKTTKLPIDPSSLDQSGKTH